jgi:hypothetical protein
MPQDFPVDFVAEYVGAKAAYTFKGRDGTMVEAPAKVQLLRFSEEGAAVMHELSAGVFDRTSPPIDYASLKRGDKLQVVGRAVIQDRSSDKDSYFAADAVRLLDAKATPITRAA